METIAQNQVPPPTPRESSLTGLEIAVIGMAGRFPGAKNVRQFWDNLKNGRESISFLSDKELEESGIETDLINDPSYVKARGGIIEDKDLFDASFFDYTPREAELMHPQIRVLHECAWAALEDAGYDPYSYDGLIGLYAGASFDLHWQALSHYSGKVEEIGRLTAAQLINRDFLCTKVSYKLNLKGPAALIQTACSTSLVAIHVAARELLTGDCDIALAGGVTIMSQKNTGYFYQEGMVYSPDGHCRAFDADAKGMIGGDGAGIVVLKPYKKAAAGGDHIYAVIKGSAVNNDGVRKAGFAAPSIKGQAEVIRTAHRFSRVEPDSISYIEAHGTGTPLGDPIEIKALVKAFNIKRNGFCRLGSVKTNVGHLDCAAGVAGFIKTVLALTHRLIPPSLHFQTPNPKIDFENSPIVVNRELVDWKNDRYPLRAGVSSFGIGGTNAHVVLEECPEGTRGLAPLSSRKYQLILLSAKTETALEQMTQNLVEHFKENPKLSMADAAYSLQVGRTRFNYRKRLVCTEVDEAIEELSSPQSRKVYHYYSNQDDRRVVFMFSGQGTQYVNIGLELYREESIFRQEMVRCLSHLPVETAADIKNNLFPDNPSAGEQPGLFQQDISQPLCFIFEYALARLLMKWGIQPDVMIGHSIGEYVAACLAGVFSLEDALNLVVFRGRLMQQLPPGVMLSVPLPEEELIPLLNDELSLAVVNGPSCIISGTEAAIAAFENQLKEKKYFCMRLNISHAGHSKMMNSMLAEFAERVKQVRLNPTQIPIISSISGEELGPRQAADPGYWKQHLRMTVRFAAGIQKLVNQSPCVFIEIGSGRDLSAVALRHMQQQPGQAHQSEQPVINLIRHQQNQVSDIYYFLGKIGDLWLYGVDIDWKQLYSKEKKYRIPLPSYPFEGERYWIESGSSGTKPGAPVSPSPLEKKPGIKNWFYIPSWKRARPLASNKREIPTNSTWLVFVNENKLGSRMVSKLEKEAQRVIVVKAAAEFQKTNNHMYTINPSQSNHYDLLFGTLKEEVNIPDRILHLWGVTGKETNDLSVETVEQTQDLGFYSLFYTAWVVGKQEITSEIRITVVTDNMQEVSWENYLCPEKSTVLGAIKVIPKEYPNIKCSSVDILLPQPGSPEEEWLADNLLEESCTLAAEQVVAYRGNSRWVKVFEPVPLEETKEEKGSRLRDQGVYLVTGGLGGIGFALAKYLARTVRARLILVGRTSLPPRDEWNRWLAAHAADADDSVSSMIRKVRELEQLEAEVMSFSADVANQGQMQEVVLRAETKFGMIDGVIHCAGVPDGVLIRRRTREMTDKVMAAKIQGTLVLNRILQDHPLDFFILCSSLASILAPYGQIGYCAANRFLDAFAGYKMLKNGKDAGLTVSINWERWRNVGMSIALEKRHNELSAEELAGMASEEGVEVFKRILEDSLPQVAVSMYDLNLQFEQSKSQVLSLPGSPKETVENKKIYRRPKLNSQYAAPGTEIEQILVNTWETFFGFHPIGVKDDFFELRGDSLIAVNMLAHIHKQLNVSVPLNEFFSNPTIEKLAQYIMYESGASEFCPLEPVEKREYYPLSSAQKRLYIVQILDIDNISYNITSTFVLEGEIDKERFKDLFTSLIERHEIFRTSIRIIEGQSVQMIHPPEEVKFDIEYSNVSGAVDSSAEAGHVIDRFVRPFDMSQMPLIRVGMIKVEENKYILIVDIHHIISDGTSMGLIMEDFLELYEGKELSPRRIQYKDYTQWQNRKKQTRLHKKQEEFWLKNFGEEVPVLNLPNDYARPALQSFEGELVSFNIEGEVTLKLKELASQQKVTSFMLLLAVFDILMAKLSGQEDIIVGTGTEGRQHIDLREIVGMFVNTLPLRNFPTADQVFVDFLKEVKETTLEAFENQDYQFEDLVEKAAVKRDLSRNPIFDVMFELKNVLDSPQRKIPTARLEHYHYELRTAKFDMDWSATEKKSMISFAIIYCTKLFKRSTIYLFIDYFRDIISNILKNPRSKFSEITKISTGRKQKILSQLQQLDKEIEVFGDKYKGQNTLQTRLNESCNRFGDRTAVEYNGQFITYTELDKRSNTIARQISVKGIKTQTFFGVLIDNRLELISAVIGILKAGCVFIPLDTSYPASRLEVMILSVGIKWIISDKENSDKLKSFEQVEKQKVELILIDELSQAKENLKEKQPVIQYRPGDEIYIYFTSGTTGTPRAILGKNKSLMHFIEWEIRTFGIEEGFRVSQLITPVFDAFLRDIFVPLCAGGVLCIPEEKEIFLEAGKLLQWTETNRIDLIHCVPALFRLLNSNRLSGRNLPDLKFILMSGEKIEPVDIGDWYDTFGDRIQLVNLFGQSETTLAKTCYFIRELDINKERIPVGKPMSGSGVVILDKSMNICGPLITGEIYIVTPFGTYGYCNDPQLTQQKFLPSPFNQFSAVRMYRTGDLGYLLPDGNIDLLGRGDRQVKIRGIRIEPGEIESLLMKHPHINEAVVIKQEAPGENNKKNEFLSAFFSGNHPIFPGENLFISHLKEYLQQRLPGYMIPARMVKMEKIPRTPNMKVDYKKIRQLVDRPQLDNTLPANDIEKKLLEFWFELLKVEKIGTADRFFELGGNSLNIMKLIAKIHREFDIRISLEEIFRNPTIRQQAGIIKSAKLEKYSIIPPAEEKEYYLLSSAQKRLFFLHQIGANTINYNIPFTVILEGEIKKDDLENAFKMLIQRHESLRTSFEMIEGEVVQKVYLHLDVELKIEYYDASQVEVQEERQKTEDRRQTTEEKAGTNLSSSDVIRHLSSEFIRPFDLSQVPLFRVGLIKVEETRHIFLFDIHHIVTDGTSQTILLQELIELYDGKEVPPLYLRYKDYSESQNKKKNQGILKLQEAYWLQRFENGIPALNIPADYSRPVVQSFAGSYINLQMDLEFTTALEALAKHENVTIYLLILALFNILLSRITGQEEIILGADTAGRNHLDLAPIIGMFVNTVVLINKPTKEKTFKEFLKEVKEKTLEAFENQDYQFDDLVEKLGLKNDGSRNPLFDVMFSFPEFESPTPAVPGEKSPNTSKLRVKPYGYEQKTSKFDMNIKLKKLPNLVVHFEYSTALFKASTIERYINYFREIVSQVLDNNDIRLQDITISQDLVSVEANISQMELEF
jgi:amino acid adenylation domain-containing protein